MHMHSLGRPSLATLLAVVVVAGCGGTEPSAMPSGSPVSTSPPAPVSTSPPAPVAMLEIDALPAATLDPTTQTVVCDPYPESVNELSGASTVNCEDGIVLGLRALTAAGLAPIERLYLHRPTCRAVPCSDDELDTATVVGWTRDGPSSVRIDSRFQVVGVSTPDVSIGWPASGSSTVPPVGLAPLAGTPAEIADRTPLPYCGRSELDEPLAVGACFRDAVVAGRPAEMLRRVFGTEGGAIDWLYRFDGHGAVRAYFGIGGRWTHLAGSMILGVTPDRWDFTPWPDTTRVITDP